MIHKKTLGIAAVEQPEWPPYGKQRFYFEDMVNACSDLPLRFFFFSPLDWSPQKPVLSGYLFEGGDWIKTTEPMPKLIYDRAFSGNAEERMQLQAFRTWLKNTTYQLLNPVDYAWLLDDKVDFHNYLFAKNLPTIETLSLESFFSHADFDTFPIYYLKPRSGSGGLGIFVVEKDEQGFRLKNHVNSDVWNFETLAALHHFFSLYMGSQPYFVQPKAKVLPYEGSPYDIRVLVQNYGQKDYRVTGAGLRLGQQGANVSNLQAGGTALPLASLESQFASNFGRDFQQEIIKLQDIALDCCHALHDSYGRFLEIGLDFLLTVDEGPVIIEGNARPSRWIFNVLADYFKHDSVKNQYYRDLRRVSVRVPGQFALNMYH